VITASELNGPLVLRHELGHSLIPVGEEYEGGECSDPSLGRLLYQLTRRHSEGFAYFGANADKVKHLHDLKWKDFLSDPENARIEDVNVPLQAYPYVFYHSDPYHL